MSGTGRRPEPTDDSFGDLYRDAEALLATLGLPWVFTLDDLHRRVERRRGRPVHLIDRELPALAPHGLWVAGDHADYVFYDGAAAPIRQHQIIGHELGHVLHDDDGAAPTPVEELRRGVAARRGRRRPGTRVPAHQLRRARRTPGRGVRHRGGAAPALVGSAPGRPRARMWSRCLGRSAGRLRELKSWIWSVVSSSRSLPAAGP